MTAEARRKRLVALRALESARRSVRDAVAPDVSDVDGHFDALVTLLGDADPGIEPGRWIVRTIDSFSDSELERTPRGKWYCPLCSSSYWGRDALARHLENPHGVCPEPGCGRVVLAAGLAAHRAYAHS